jgi:hypothetical protein
MSRLTKTAAALCLAVFGLAFAVAPHACGGGIEVYFWSGVAATFILLALPWIMRRDRSAPIRAALSLGWGLAGVLASIRFFCVMF